MTCGKVRLTFVLHNRILMQHRAMRRRTGLLLCVVMVLGDSFEVSVASRP